MKIYGLEEEPDKQMVDHVMSWLKNNPDMVVSPECLIFVSARCALLIGGRGSDIPWVVFWNPWSNPNKKTFTPSQWYDWFSIPKNNRNAIMDGYRKWQTHFDDTALRDVAPFHKRG